MGTPDILIRRFPAGWQVAYVTDKAAAFRDTFFTGRAAEDWPSLVWFKICAERAGMVIDISAPDKASFSLLEA